MNFGELKDELVALINRKDLTTVRAGRFLNRAVDRLERNVRLPFMERLVEYTITDSPDIDLPTDFIELANLFVDDVELEQVDMRRRSEEHTSELQSLMRISYAVFCLKKKKKQQN